MNNVIESSSIQTENFAITFRFDRGSSGSVVHKSQFTEEFSRFVSLEVSLSAINDFKAVELSFLDDEKSVTLLSFNDHVLIGNS